MLMSILLTGRPWQDTRHCSGRFWLLLRSSGVFESACGGPTGTCGELLTTLELPSEAAPQCLEDQKELIDEHGRHLAARGLLYHLV